ncbi:MAG: hypothetical protein IJ799_06030 [Bacteroidales bacterium]|nr:hypothetical protein [Bacteroidales bacterium]
MKTKLLSAAIGLLVLAACSQKEDEPVYESKEGSYVGTVTVHSKSGVVENENVTVEYIPQGNTASIVFHQIRFVPAMPPLDVTVPEILVEASSGTEAVLTCSRVIPLALGGEFPQYEVTDFEGKVSAESLSFSLNFGSTPTSFAGTAK